MAQKLYHGEVTIHYYFLAEEGEEWSAAEEYAQEAIRDSASTYSPDVSEVTRMEHMIDWEDHTALVYGDHDSDISLKEAFEISNEKTYEQADQEFKARFKKG